EREFLVGPAEYVSNPVDGGSRGSGFDKASQRGQVGNRDSGRAALEVGCRHNRDLVGSRRSRRPLDGSLIRNRRLAGETRIDKCKSRKFGRRRSGEGPGSRQGN